MSLPTISCVDQPKARHLSQPGSMSMNELAIRVNARFVSRSSDKVNQALEACGPPARFSSRLRLPLQLSVRKLAVMTRAPGSVEV
jgi:hypothetical protein